MNSKPLRWDESEYLETPEQIAAYLEAALEDGAPKIIEAVLGDIARATNQVAINLE
jgi:probable addiction module antidote protein